jgi:hypothetical protein
MPLGGRKGDDSQVQVSTNTVENNGVRSKFDRRKAKLFAHETGSTRCRRKIKSPDKSGLFLNLEARAGVEPAYTALQAAA